MRPWALAILLLCLPIWLVLASNTSANQGSTDETHVLERISMNIGANDEVQVELQGRIRNSLIAIVLPFMLENDLSYLPRESVTALQDFEGGYSVLFIFFPKNLTEFTVRATSRGILEAQSDRREVALDFSYKDAPSTISQLIARNDTYYMFREIVIVLPVGASDVFDLPSSQSVTKEAAFVNVNLLISFLVGLPTAIAIVRIPSDEIKSRTKKGMFAILTLAFVGGAGFLTWELFVYGLEWDSLSLFYLGIVENLLAFLAKLLTVIRPQILRASGISADSDSQQTLYLNLRSKLCSLK
jgi:hypothetical protein